MKKLFIACITLFFMVSFVPNSLCEANEEQPIEVKTLYNELETENFNPEFDDPLTVTGIVIETGISKYATPFVSLSDKKNGTVYAVCVLPRADSFKLKDFKKGEKVILQGHFYAFRDRVVIKKCRKIKLADNGVN
ncbi:MAG: hypothetical protein FWH43_03060 [Endomicrobia bacterium]|nr:hypothetical protein [Endomicrobiia bacterium]